MANSKEHVAVAGAVTTVQYKWSVMVGCAAWWV